MLRHYVIKCQIMWYWQGMIGQNDWAIRICLELFDYHREQRENREEKESVLH